MSDEDLVDYDYYYNYVNIDMQRYISDPLIESSKIYYLLCNLKQYKKLYTMCAENGLFSIVPNGRMWSGSRTHDTIQDYLESISNTLLDIRDSVYTSLIHSNDKDEPPHIKAMYDISSQFTKNESIFAAYRPININHHYSESTEIDKLIEVACFIHHEYTDRVAQHLKDANALIDVLNTLVMDYTKISFFV
jgi:hypothetical protein